MKLLGQTFDAPNEEVLVLIRKGKDLVFKASAVLDFDNFDAMCPRPTPPKVFKPGGVADNDTEDVGYLQQLDNWSKLRTSYMIIQSLKATDGLEWDTIKDDDPSTWGNFREELKKAFFSDREIMLIINSVWAANGMDDNKLDEARKRFLAGQQKEASDND